MGLVIDAEEIILMVREDGVGPPEQALPPSIYEVPLPIEDHNGILAPVRDIDGAV
jgi:hypothetical protein